MGQEQLSHGERARWQGGPQSQGGREGGSRGRRDADNAVFMQFSTRGGGESYDILLRGSGFGPLGKLHRQ